MSDYLAAYVGGLAQGSTTTIFLFVSFSHMIIIYLFPSFKRYFNLICILMHEANLNFIFIIEMSIPKRAW